MLVDGWAGRGRLVIKFAMDAGRSDRDDKRHDHQAELLADSLKTLVLSFILAGYVVAVLFKLNGFCFGQMRWVPDDELIKASLEYQIATRAPDRPDISDVGAFLARYPECCEVAQDSAFIHDDIFINALLLRQFYEVRATYPVIDSNGNDGSPYYDLISIIECCSKSIAETYGMPQDQMPAAFRLAPASASN